MFSKQQLFDFFAILILACLIFLCGISQMDVGLWEPWETSTILIAQHLSQSAIPESTFWVPKLDGEFVAQPYIELWALMALLHAFPDASAFLLRLPGACAGIFLVILSFFAIKQATTRRAAWMSSAILLTIPMFVLTGKFIHGDIWLILAVSLPNLLFIMACYASTRRMQRAMLSLTALSVSVSFLSGGLFAMAFLLIEGILSWLLIRRHPHKKLIFAPLKTQYFLFPLYISFLICGCVFGIFVTEARYVLENRIPMTLSEINDALDDNRVITIERRKTQIIGTLSTIVDGKQHPFVLVESHENRKTNATDIFKLNESEVKTFEKYLDRHFHQKTPSRAIQQVPPIDDAFATALRFFWYHTNTPYMQSTMPLAQVNPEAIEKDPLSTIIRTEKEIKSGQKLNPLQAISNIPTQTTAGEYVRILNDEPDSEWMEIQTANGRRGFLPRRILTIPQAQSNIRWTSWIDVLLFGLLPWGCFFPIIFVCAMISARKLSIAPVPFQGDFKFLTNNEPSPSRSPIQSMLFSWIIVSMVALFVGINQSRHDIFAGLVPVAALLAIALTSPRFWLALRENLESRIALILTSFICLGIAIYEFKLEPFRIVRYLMTDPLMHWDNNNIQLFNIHIGSTITFVILFVLLTFISFSGAAESIQEKINQWRIQHNRPQKELKPTSSSTTLMRIARGENEPIPYAPTISLAILGALFSGFIYFEYIPSISDDLTETALIARYFELANQAEPIYQLTGETSQLCLTYRDCEPGYVCQNSHCRISTFSSYSLNVAHPLSRQGMLEALSPNHPQRPAFYIVPKDMLFNLNQSYRKMFPPEKRTNLTVLEAPSSRLYLIGNPPDVPSVNPMENLLPTAVPSDASPFSMNFGSVLSLEGFKINKLDFDHSKTLELTLYYRVNQPLSDSLSFHFSFELSSRKIEADRPILDPKYDMHGLLPGDLVSNTFRFELTTMPSHGYLDVYLSMDNPTASAPRQHLTTIGF
ncbi:MAG: hypothetical protein IJM59_10895 [Proteobacteria bacterium]|nr:hypothetical protein [Pseudomonadota bacterium]